MKRNNIYIKGLANATRRLALGCLLLFFMVGSAWAQTTGGQFVIKKKAESGDMTPHYLAHVNTGGNNWALQDTIAFSPSCLWISDNTFSPGGTNKNYYFYDNNNNPRFLISPEFQAGGRLGLSETTPTGSDLGTPEFPYYFYRWDSGLGRGIQYFGVNQETCQHEWKWMDEEPHSVGECWEVYWVSYDSDSDSWKLSDDEYYELDDVRNGARYHAVTVTEHPQDTTAASGTGLRALSDIEMVYGGTPQSLAAVIDFPYNYSFTPVYTEYQINESFYPNPANLVTHNYYDHADHLSGTPQQQSRSVGNTPAPTYHWTKFGDGAAYITISDSSADSPTLTYSTLNDEGDKLAYLVLTVTYSDGSKQRDTAEVTVKTPCRNPGMAAAPVVTDVGVTVSWYPTAENYTVSWKEDVPAVTVWNSVAVGNVTSYTIRGLAYGTDYVYKVATSCDTEEPEEHEFTTNAEPPGMIVYGAIFGGGRMADVGGNTEVVLINFDSIGAVYGGNDIAGAVQGNNGSTIVMGVNAGGTYASYGTTTATVSTPLKFGSVYGGGNGYYAYNGTSFVAASSTYNSETVAVDASVREMTQEHEVGEVVWTNTGAAPKTLSFPTIKKTSITVTDDYVKADSIFGGAKNAFLTHNVANENGSFIDIEGGTIFAVFGGNNFGGTQGAAKQHIEVHHTNINLASRIDNTDRTGYGRTFGIRYLFGGGNKVDGSASDVYIYGGQLDSIFAGGNSADVAAARMEVNCSLGADAGTVDATGSPNASGQHLIFGNTYTNAFVPANYTSGSIGATTIDTVNYAWDGYSGIYNVRTLFGGNNKASMQIVPDIVLTSGSVGIVYGGGNAGDMVAQQSGGSISFIDGAEFDTYNFTYGTHVVLNSDKILVDYLYGGCQMSNVLYSTWVELQKGHVGYVYGGCNISGDVGSTRVNPTAPSSPPSEAYQAVYGATYVRAKASDGNQVTVYKDLFAGGNGYYHCSQDGIHYSDGDFVGIDPLGRQYIGMTVPTHNETHAIVSTGATIRRNVYAGGNLACVGFDDNTGNYNDGHGYVRNFPELVGMASVRMEGGSVKGNVYGGGNMASIFGSNEVRVTNGTIRLGLYGGNDCSGQVAEKTNRVLPSDHTFASDTHTSLTDLGVKTYVGVKGNAKIGTVYGGGNGDYDPDDVQYCYTNYEPIQRYTFVDIHINGGANGGKIRTVYGGGNGVTVRHGVTVFLNINEPNVPEDFNNVDTIFGGNNKGNLAVVPDIRLIHGQVGTVYGGCNRGMMTAEDDNLKTIGGYENTGSYVRLRNTYQASASSTPVDVTAKVTQAVYGGCRMNGVTNNSLVLVEGGDFSGIPIFGGSDISGTVSGDSRVAVVGGTVGKVYGGGNGYYTYNPNGSVYTIPTSGDPVLVATGITTAPICAQSGADILGGRVGTDASHRGEVFGGGYGELTSTTGNVVVNVGPATATSWTGLPVIYGEVYGGSALGTVNTDGTNSTTVNFLNGTLHGSLFGGGLGEAGNENVGKGQVNGKVYVSISNADQLEENCFIDLRDADVYGCNNTNGSPKDDVRVDVYKTAYNFSDYTSGNHYTSQEGEDPYYAIDEVFGGGNQADYTPTGKKTLVYVHDCRNTIKRVFSGGNAAAATGVSAIIEGGRFDYIFGGGNGEVSAANIGAGGTDLTVSAGIINHLFGGSNQQGVVSGSVITDINGSNYVPEDDEFNDPCNEEIAEVYGGSNAVDLGSDGHPISIETTIECRSGMIGTIYGGCNQADITGDVSLTIQGGTFDYVYGGSKGVADDGADISGDVTLNLEGGTIRTAFGGSNVKGNIGGRIIVNVIDIEDCPLVIDTVFGGGNHANYEPYYSVSGTERVSPLVNVMHIKPTAQAQGIRGCVFGGGNEAWVTSSPRVNIGYNATNMPNAIPTGVNTGLLTNFPQTYVKGKIFGGGNNITAENKGVEGNTRVYVYNGQVCQNIATGEQSVGIYGGCNTSGTVTGNSHVAILGGTIGNSTTRANIHGGGFGSATEVKNNVTVDFGAVAYDESGEDPVEIHTDEPKLYGDLYGGSALGNVNHNNTQTTTVNILNGEITGVGTSGDGRYGNVFGGGLGDASHAALVHGRVFVNVGACDTPPSSDLSGKAKLDNCNIFGCNNISGSPQDSVYVHVYQTDHIEGVNTVNNGNGYAILRVYGGGNLSNYAPENDNPNSGKKTHVYVHSCDNTIKFVFGGSNAADAVGVQTLIEGGRFDEIYGGGNGTTIPANIGKGGIGINVNGGHARYYFEGNNHLGEIGGPINQPRPSFPTGYTECTGSLIIDSYYFGDNEAEHYGDLEGEITCEQGRNFNYKYVFAGSRWAIVYGDIKLTVKGGNIQYLYGGSKGYGEVDDPRPADVRRFPSYAELNADDLLENQKYSSALKDYMRDTINHPERKALVGHGGNIVLTVQGGTIGDVIGGCEELGNVEGKITVIIDELDDTECPLVLGNVYGASKQTDYVPTNDATHHAYYAPTTDNAVPTPQVKILKGTVGSVDSVTFIVSQEKVAMEGNVFGGGDIGNVTANPKVIVGESSNTSPVEILGNVYGGGKEGSVDGSPEVIIVPNKHTLQITQPENTSQGVIRVTDRYNNSVSSGTEIDEYQDLNLVAIPSVYGWKLNKWEVTNGSVLFEKSVNTMFTMGTNDASIKAHFVSVPTNTLTIANQGPGSVTVTDGLNVGVTNYASIGEGAVLNLMAEPTENGYAFLKWEVTGTGSFVANEYDPNTTFTMGTANTTVTAVFKPTHQLTIATHQEMEHGSITVIDILGRAVHTGADIAEGARLTIVANPDDDYEFDRWTVTNGVIEDDTAISTTFVMGNDDGDASISAIFNAQQTEPEP